MRPHPSIHQRWINCGQLPHQIKATVTFQRHSVRMWLIPKLLKLWNVISSVVFVKNPRQFLVHFRTNCNGSAKNHAPVKWRLVIYVFQNVKCILNYTCACVHEKTKTWSSIRCELVVLKFVLFIEWNKSAYSFVCMLNTIRLFWVVPDEVPMNSPIQISKITLGKIMNSNYYMPESRRYYVIFIVFHQHSKHNVDETQKKVSKILRNISSNFQIQLTITFQLLNKIMYIRIAVQYVYL